MKTKKISLTILSFAMILILNTGKVNAIVARVTYDPVNIFLSNILKIAPIILSIAYILVAIIYYIKSKKDKKQKIIRLVIWLILIAILSTTLYFCADIVYEAGASYTGGPINPL